MLSRQVLCNTREGYIGYCWGGELRRDLRVQLSGAGLLREGCLKGTAYGSGVPRSETPNLTFRTPGRAGWASLEWGPNFLCRTQQTTLSFSPRKTYPTCQRRKWQPTPIFLPRESQGQRSLMCYSPWGRTESDTTEAT